MRPKCISIDVYNGYYRWTNQAEAIEILYREH